MLTKTSYLTYIQCSKAFWFEKYQPELSSPPDPALQRRLQAGQEIDKLSQGQYSGGILIPYHRSLKKCPP